MNSEKPVAKRAQKGSNSNLHITEDFNTTVRTLLNPFRITEEPRHGSFTITLIHNITKTLEEIINKTSSVQQQIQLNNILTHLREISHQIDQTNVERSRFSNLFESLQVVPPLVQSPVACPYTQQSFASQQQQRQPQLSEILSHTRTDTVIEF